MTSVRWRGTLAAWCEAKALASRAVEKFDAWLAREGGTVGGYGRDELTVEFCEHSLVLHAHPAVAPGVRTRLELSAGGGDWPLGSFELITRLDGTTDSVHVDLDAKFFKDGSFFEGGGPAEA